MHESPADLERGPTREKDMGKHSQNRFGRQPKPQEVKVGRRPSEDAPEPTRTKRSKRKGALEESPELPVHRERKRSRLKMVLAIVGIIVLAAVIGAAAWSYSFIRNVNAQMQGDFTAQVDAAAAAVTEPAPPGEPITILLLGSDIRPDEETARADTIIVARFDPETKKTLLVSIPRDTRAEIPGHGVGKINQANYLGGPALMIETVEELLDISVNHYMEIDFKGFVGIVDALGGVYIDVDTEIDDWKAASHSKGHRASHIDPGYQLLDGEYALTYVRSRDFIDADFTRMRHQQEFFKALAKQSTRFDNLLRMPNAIGEFAKATTTDLGVTDLLGLGNSMRGIEEDDIQTATLSGEWRSPYVYPDEELLARLSAALNDGGDIEEASAEADESGVIALDPSTVDVTVRNGAGTVGVASEASDVLLAAGFPVPDVGNANQFVYEETLVVYREDQAWAEAVAMALPVAKVIPSRGMYLFDSDVLVVVGKDWPIGYRPGDPKPGDQTE